MGLRQLSSAERAALVPKLWEAQQGQCFITGKKIDLSLHVDNLDIDHIVPLRDNGPDEQTNWALTFASANRSKQAANLHVARILSRLDDIRSSVSDPRGINLGHILAERGGAKHELKTHQEESGAGLRYSLAAIGKPEVVTAPIWRDRLSGLRYVFVMLPKEYLFHDSDLNPRGIGSNIRGLIEEFYKGYPQLHVPLAWIDTDEKGGPKVRIFDGQHKAAAQLLLGEEYLPVRLFIDPDHDLLLTANNHAGTTLRQVAFDKATQRHMGASIYRDRVVRFRAERNHPEDYSQFTEQQLVDHFKGEQAQMKRYIIDHQRNAILYDPENRLRDFIEMGGKGTDRPISYSAVEKSVYSQLICGMMLDTPDDYRLEEGENPRDLERSQTVRLINILADRIYIGKYDFEVGSGKLESKVQKGEPVDPVHLRAHRIGREEVLHAMFGLAVDVCQMSVVSAGGFWDKDRPFQRRLPNATWNTLDNFVKNFGELSVWKSESLSLTVFGGKQNYQFWKEAFKTGTANGVTILPGPLNLLELMKSADD